MMCLSTALIWLTIHVLREPSVSPRILWAMGLFGGGIILIKPTGMVVVALVALALFVYQWPLLRQPWRIHWARVSALARFTLPIVGLYGLLIVLRLILNRASTGTSSVAGMNITLIPKYSFQAYLQNEYTAGGSYFVWLFIKTFWGTFGWLEISLPEWIYSTILVCYGIGVIGYCLGLVVDARNRRWSLLLSVLIIGQLAFLFVIADYVLSFAQLGIGLGLQGRYLFPVLAPILFLLVSGWYTLSGQRKFILYLAPVAVLLLQLVSLATIITKYYGVTFGWWNTVGATS